MASQIPSDSFRKIEFAPNKRSKELFAEGLQLFEEKNIEKAHLCWIKAIQTDRSHLAPYTALSELYETVGEGNSKAIIDTEIRRLQNVSLQFPSTPSSEYFSELAEITSLGELPQKPRRILVVTNLFPPQEMGGFGKTMWELCAGLIKKGHEVKIMTSDSPYLNQITGPESYSIEKNVTRCFELFGNWKKGVVEVEQDQEVLTNIAVKNHLLIRQALEAFKPEVCIVGNVDLMGYPFIKEILNKGIPVIHRLGNKEPGYPVEDTPQHPKYCMAAASNWLIQSLKEQKHPIERFETLFPGSPLEKYYRYVLPDFSKLKIVFAGIIAPFKGFHILIEALAVLKANNIPFECHAIGNNTNETYYKQILDFVEEKKMQDQIHFYGYQSRKAMVRMFDQCNTLVFPTIIEEAFGKSQIEAMASGLAVISSATGGAAEVVVHGKNGLTFKGGDALDLATKLLFLTENPEESFQLARNGQMSSTKYSTPRSVSKLEAIIESML